MSVDTLQQQTSLQPEGPDEVVEYMVAHSPDTSMSHVEELRARSNALDDAVNASAHAGLEEQHVERLHHAVGRRWAAFDRGLSMGDSPAC